MPTRTKPVTAKPAARMTATGETGGGEVGYGEAGGGELGHGRGWQGCRPGGTRDAARRQRLGEGRGRDDLNLTWRCHAGTARSYAGDDAEKLMPAAAMPARRECWLKVHGSRRYSRTAGARPGARRRAATTGQHGREWRGECRKPAGADSARQRRGAGVLCRYTAKPGHRSRADIR